MARFKEYDYNQSKMIPISFDRQILPGTFEYSLCYLVDHELDLSIFESSYKNDYEGRPAYDPAILLKIVLLAYSKGITSSRKIEQLCRDNIVFMAISADSQPHFTTLAHFISGSSEQIETLFLQVLLTCDDLGLVGKEMFAIDGCKMPSNASKEWSGTRAELLKKQKKMEKAIRYILKKHRETDAKRQDSQIIEREKHQIETLKKASQKIKKHLDTCEEKTGVNGNIVKGNVTDPDSAKMKTSHGVIQGYNGVAAVDSKHQIIVHAEAYGRSQEHGLLEPMIEKAHENLKHSQRAKRKTKITADSGYHNHKALDYLNEQGIDGYIADTGFRSRDPRFKDYKNHKPKSRLKRQEKYTVSDFKVDRKKKTCVCPAGNPMWLKGEFQQIEKYIFMQFQAYEKDCPVCPQKKKCLRNPNQKTPRQINVNRGITRTGEQSLIEQMKVKIDSDSGRHIYSQRIGTVEPVFGNIKEMIGFKRFSLRGKDKVNAQWQLVTMLHNILKIHRYGWAW